MPAGMTQIGNNIWQDASGAYYDDNGAPLGGTSVAQQDNPTGTGYQATGTQSPQTPQVAQTDNPNGPGYQNTGNPSGYGGYGDGTGTTGTTDPNGGGGFQFPTFTPPTYQGPGAYNPGQYQAPQPFSYQDFQAPTLEQAQSQPGYQFARDQGQKALENSAAARGMLRSGGTLKDLFSWGDQFAQQNYGNVFNQNAQVYNTNRQNAADNYNTNVANQLSAYGVNNQAGLGAYNANLTGANQNFQNNFQGAAAQFNPQFQAAQLQFSDLYNRWRDRLNATTQIAGYGAQ